MEGAWCRKSEGYFSSSPTCIISLWAESSAAPACWVASCMLLASIFHTTNAPKSPTEKQKFILCWNQLNYALDVSFDVNTHQLLICVPGHVNVDIIEIIISFFSPSRAVSKHDLVWHLKCTCWDFMSPSIALSHFCYSTIHRADKFLMPFISEHFMTCLRCCRLCWCVRHADIVTKHKKVFACLFWEIKSKFVLSSSVELKAGGREGFIRECLGQGSTAALQSRVCVNFLTSLTLLMSAA